MSQRPHIVVVAWGFPPFRGSGVYRPLAMVNQLASLGARVTVVTATREPFLVHYGADPDLENLVDPSVRIERVPFFPDLSWPLVGDWSATRAYRGKRWRERHAADGTDLFPEAGFSSWLPRLTARLRALADEGSIDGILATGNPYVDLQAAVVVAGERGIPVWLDDRDLFLADRFTGEPDVDYTARLPYFERWLQTTQEFWFVNRPIAQWHRDRFPTSADRLVVVENGWDATAVNPELIEPRPAGRPLTFGYVGVLSPLFPLSEVLGAWREAVPRLPAGSRLVFCGALGWSVNSGSGKRFLRALRSAPNVEYRGHVPRTQLSSVYAELDVLLLARAGGNLVTGSKTYEYAATGLPIVAQVPADSDTVQVLAGYPRLHVAQDLQAGADHFVAAADDRRNDNGTRLAQAQKVGAALSRQQLLRPHLVRLIAACTK